MATAVATPSVTKQWADSDYHVFGTIAIDASPATYLTGGLVLNFLQAAIKAQRAPIRVTVSGIAGYQYSYVPGSTAGNGKLIIRAQTSGAAAADPLGEITSATAIPAAVSGDTITFTADFYGML